LATRLEARQALDRQRRRLLAVEDFGDVALKSGR
jgi:hypothetical protein